MATKKAGKEPKSKAKSGLKDLDVKTGKNVKGGGVSTTLTVKRGR